MKDAKTREFYYIRKTVEHGWSCSVLTYQEAFDIAVQMKWTSTRAREKGRYSTSRPSRKLNALLQPYKMTPGAWRRRLLAPR